MSIKKTHFTQLYPCRQYHFRQSLAGSTGLEPATSCVTGRRSNQLSYDPKFELNCSISVILKLGKLIPLWYRKNVYPKLSSPPTNHELANLFRNIAAALTVKNEDRFRILAYQKAADSIENSPQEAHVLYLNNQLEELPGIGDSLAEHLSDLFQSGTSSELEEIFDNLPAGMFAILPIPGIGPKHAHKLASHLGLTRFHSALTTLEKSARQGEIQQIPGYKADFEAKVLRNLQEYQLIQSNPRHLLHLADKVAQEIITYLQKNNFVLEVNALGSLRRRASTIGDIDLAAKTNNPQAVLKHFVSYPQVQKVISQGDTKASIITANCQVDLITQTPDKYGALLVHFTGSKSHNIKLREHALSLGYSLSEHGLKNKSKQLMALEDEQSLYRTLGLDWVPPELREGTDEITLASQSKLPTLVSLSDIKGEFHIHSNFDIEPSHDSGLSSMTQMIDLARARGYQYLAFSEHNPYVANHPVSRIVELVKSKYDFIQELNHQESTRENNRVKIFNSLEIDIQSDGNLALPDGAWEYLDFAVVSIHSSFTQDLDTTTRRILKALSHPKAKILGHPTGRTLLRRSGVQADWETIFKFCAQHNKWLDIDGWPDRLDLPDTLIYEAKRFGVKFAISSDAHQVDHMDMIKYGVDTARRGWATPQDIVNTYPLADLERLLK